MRNLYCPHGHRWGDGDGYMAEDRAIDGCVYPIDAETADVRDRAAAVTKLNRQLHAALAARDTFRATVLLSQLARTAEGSAQTPYRTVDHAHRRSTVVTEARRIRDALDASETYYHIARGQIGSSREIIDALTACIEELSR